MDTFEKMMAYEQGELEIDECIQLFQELVETELVWSLQGHYQRTARALIEEGLIHVNTQLAFKL